MKGMKGVKDMKKIAIFFMISISFKIFMSCFFVQNRRKSTVLSAQLSMAQHVTFYQHRILLDLLRSSLTPSIVTFLVTT